MSICPLIYGHFTGLNFDILGELLKCLCNPLFELPGNVLSMPISVQLLIAYVVALGQSIKQAGSKMKCGLDTVQIFFFVGVVDLSICGTTLFNPYVYF